MEYIFKHFLGDVCRANSHKYTRNCWNLQQDIWRAYIWRAYIDGHGRGGDECTEEGEKRVESKKEELKNLLLVCSVTMIERIEIKGSKQDYALNIVFSLNGEKKLHEMHQSRLGSQHNCSQLCSVWMCEV